MDAGELLTIDPTTLTAAELSDLVLGLDRLVSDAQAALRRTVGVWDAQMVWADDGAANAAQWLSARAGLSRPAAGAEVRTARSLRNMPLVAVESRAGRLHSAKVAVFARVVDLDVDVLAKAFERDEELLVGHAKELTVDQTARMLRHWRALADTDLADGDAADLRERRGLHVSQTFAGMWKLDGLLDPEAGAIVAGAINDLADELHRQRDEAASDDQTVTPTQRRADALVELTRRGTAADGSDTARPARPLVIVTADIETLEGRANRPVELDTGGSITPEAARRLACDADIARIITGPGSQPLDIGRTSRNPTPAMRRALLVRDKHCQFPGCTAPPNWSHAHHIQWWTNDGVTAIENLVLLCPFHHHLVHEGGFGLARAPDGTLQFSRPDGSIVHAQAAP